MGSGFLPLLVDLDLAKYGLGHLARKRPIDFTATEVDQVLDALTEDDMAVPVFDANSDPRLWHELLRKSYCRGCGKCCVPNPKNPQYPGVEALEDELKAIVKKFHISPRAIKRGTKKRGQIRNPDPPYQVINTRWLTLPCMFHDFKTKQCKVYQLRPMVCRIHPLVFKEDAILLKVNCEYGKDLYRIIMSEIRSKAQSTMMGYKTSTQTTFNPMPLSNTKKK